MATRGRPLSPHLQVYKPQLPSVLSILHRITGVALAVGTLVLVWWLVAAAIGGGGGGHFTNYYGQGGGGGGLGYKNDITVKRGDMIDFVVTQKKYIYQDNFKWNPVIKVTEEVAQALAQNNDAKAITQWTASEEFEGESFKAKPLNAGCVCDRGLWRYTRHPNYFGEALLWWGVWCFAAMSTGALWTIVSPILLTTLLLKVSGVRLLEQTLTDTKPAYADYIARTSAFLPWFPK